MVAVGDEGTGTEANVVIKGYISFLLLAFTNGQKE